MIMTRERDRVLVHVFSALGAILLWIGFWTTRIPPITIVDGSLNAENVYHGDKFRVRRIITGHRLDCGQPILESTLVDSYDIEHRYVAVSASVKPGLGTNTVEGRERVIPSTLPFGPTEFHAKLIYSCFPFYSFWPINVEAPLLRFVIMPR